MSTEAEADTLLAMQAIDELMAQIEEKEESIRESIRDAELQLGMGAVRVREALGLRVGGKLLEAALDASAAVASAAEAAENGRALLDERRRLEDELEHLMREASSEDGEKRRLSIRLGAMIYEQCSFSLLDKEQYRIVYDDVEADRQLEVRDGASIFSRLLGSGKARVRKMGEESRFISYAGIALASGTPPAGERSESLFSELQEAVSRKKAAEHEADSISERIEAAREKARDSERDLAAADGRVRSASSAEEKALVDYGSFLYDKGSSWIDKDTPSDILDSLEELLSLHGEYDKVLAEKARLEREAKADDLRAMIESEEGKIMVLEKEKERIDREIEELRSNIEAMRMRIGRLGL